MPDINGLKLLSRYALPPNSLGYCGKDSAPERFKKCITEGECADVAHEITHFIVLHPYLQTISQILGKDLYDYEVAECLWLGNDNLEKFTPEHYNILLGYFLKQGVPQNFVEELRQNVPKKFLPFHLFQVLHVGVGKSSGAVPFNLDSINNCMIRWGKIEEINGLTVKIALNELMKENAHYILTNRLRSFDYDPRLITKPKIGDTVTVHWNIVNNILTVNQVNNLKRWTEETLSALFG